MKEFVNKRNFIYLSAILLIVALSFYFINRGSLKSQEGGPVDSDNIMYVEDSYPELSTEEKFQKSTLVIEGKFKGQSKPFTLEPEDGRPPMVFKDSKFQVVKVFKGPAEEGQIIRVRNLGGQSKDQDGEILNTVSDQVRIKYTGKNNYLFFLSTFPGSTYKTKEDYYEPILGSLSIYTKNKEGTLYTSIGIPGESISVEEVASIYDVTDPHAEYRQDLERSLEEGEITQEEYNQALKNFDVYDKKIE